MKILKNILENLKEISEKLLGNYKKSFKEIFKKFWKIFQIIPLRASRNSRFSLFFNDPRIDFFFFFFLFSTKMLLPPLHWPAEVNKIQWKCWRYLFSFLNAETGTTFSEIRKNFHENFSKKVPLKKFWNDLGKILYNNFIDVLKNYCTIILFFRRLKKTFFRNFGEKWEKYFETRGNNFAIMLRIFSKGLSKSFEKNWQNYSTDIMKTLTRFFCENLVKL